MVLRCLVALGSMCTVHPRHVFLELVLSLELLIAIGASKFSAIDDMFDENRADG